MFWELGFLVLLFIILYLASDVNKIKTMVEKEHDYLVQKAAIFGLTPELTKEIRKNDKRRMKK